MMREKSTWLLLGILGCGDDPARHPPVQSGCPLPQENPQFIQLATDGYAVMALRSDGRAVCWGDDTDGQCGFEWAGGESEPRLSKASHCATSVSLDGNGSAILQDGKLGLWGQEDSSQFGDGEPVTQSLGKMVVVPLEAPVVSAAMWAAYAVTENGGVYCWGPVCSASGPQYDPIPYPWTRKAIEAAMVVADGPICLLDKRGDVYCRGDNEHGEVGDGTFEPRDEFTKVLLPGPATTIAAHVSGACAVLATGEVACWGTDSGTLEKTPTPTLIENVSGVTKIRVSRSGGACAFAIGGPAACWGSGLAAHLPDGLGTKSARPFDLYVDILDMALSGPDGCVLRTSDKWVYCVGQLRAVRYDEAAENEALRSFKPIPEPIE